ncbi:MAG: gliding motility-associated C-terminal domain-containing protein [Flavobacteriaceae bacterium]|nr:gliding motility-associated C-terminal domain-containing protein [Flavobacteriaceae bacterium]
MRKASLSFIGNIMAVFTLSFLCSLEVLSTTLTNPTLDCFSCTGEAVYTTELTGDVLFEWYDDNGSLLLGETTNVGTSSLFNLCQGVYQVQATNGQETSFEWFVISTQGSNLPEALLHNNCNSGPPINLSNLFQGNLPTGGQWYNPNGTPNATGIIPPATAQSGWYAYEILVDACVQTSGVQLNIVQNANPGLSETYLICETYEPFELDEQLDGADLGGVWFDPNQNPFTGLYTPTQDQPGTYVYMIDTVEFCPAVFSTLTILENTLADVGEDNTLFVCPGAVQVNLLDYLGGTPEAGGTWFNTNNQTFNGQFDPSVMPAGEYRYRILGAVPCPNQESSVFVSFTNEISAGIGEDHLACLNEAPNFNLNNSLDGSQTLGGLWLNESGTQIDAIIPADLSMNGDYTYLVTAVGCDDESTLVNVFFEAPLNAGNDQDLFFCSNQLNILASEITSPEMSLGGIWMMDNSPVVFPLDLTTISGSATLNYEVSPLICPADDSQTTINIDTALPSFSDAVLTFCSSDANFVVNSLATPDYPDVSFLSSNPVFDDGIFEPSSLQNATLEIEVNSNNACPNESFFVDFLVDESLVESQTLSSLNCENGEIINLNDFFPTQTDWTISTWEINGQPSSNEVVAESASSGIYTYAFDHQNACGDAALTLDLSIELSPFAGPDQSFTFCANEAALAIEDFVAFTGNPVVWDEEFTNQMEVFNPADGSQNIALVVQEVGPCISDTAWIDIVVDAGVALNAGEDQAICQGESVQIQSSEHPTYEYSWSPSAGLSNSTNAQTSFTSSLGAENDEVFVFQLLISNGVCTFEDELEVLVHPLPELSLSGDLEVCLGELISAQASGAQSIFWVADAGEDGQTGAIVIDTEQSGNVEIDLVSLDGCSNNFEVPYVVHPIPDAQFDASPLTGCVPHEVLVQNLSENEGAVNYLWQIGATTQNAVSPDPFVLFEAGSFDVTLQAINEWGCTASQTIEDYIQAYPLPIADFELLSESISADYPFLEVDNQSEGASSWVWNLNGNTSISSSWEPQVELAYPEESQLLELCLFLENDFGCTDSTCRDVLLFTTLNVFIPNAFTPDFDGVNDGFKPVINGYAPDSYHLMIFNRWGELIFESFDPNEYWFGSALQAGEYFAPDGIYEWFFEVADDFSGEIKQFQGHVSLLR